MVYFLIGMVMLCRWASADVGGVVRGNCRQQEDPTVVVTDNGCNIKGRFWFNDRKINYLVDRACADSGWLFSPLQPKPCDLEESEAGYNVRKGNPGPSYTVIHGWCGVLEGVSYSRDATHCNVTGYIIVADKEVALRHVPNHGHVFPIKRACEIDNWVLEGRGAVRCVAIGDPTGVRFFRNEQPAQTPKPTVNVPIQAGSQSEGSNAYIYLLFLVIFDAVFAVAFRRPIIDYLMKGSLLI